MNCPHCEKELTLKLTASIPPEQKVTVSVDHAAPFMSAQTVGGLIVNTEKLLKAVARDIGGRVHVFIERIDWTERNLQVHFVITDVSSEEGKRMQAELNRLSL